MCAMYRCTKAILITSKSLTLRKQGYSMFDIFKEQKSTQWNGVLSEAERILGANKAFVNLEWLISNELKDLSTHVYKLKTRNLAVYDEMRDTIYNNDISWGLIVMLFSKIVENFRTRYGGIKNDVQQKHYIIAKVTHMMHISIMIHKCVRNMYSENYSNKIAILFGDYLLSNCLRDLASLRDQHILEFMSSALRDLTIGQCLPSRDNYNIVIAQSNIKKDISHLDNASCDPIEFSKQSDNAKSIWLRKHTLGGSSLLGKGCSSVVKLSNHCEQYQNLAYFFGKYFGLAYQAYSDIKEICCSSNSFNQYGLPLLLHIEGDPKFFDRNGNSKLSAEECSIIRRNMLNGTTLNKAHEIKKQFSNAACTILNIFGKSDAQILLNDIIKKLEI